jgi:hypothetical protein
VQNTLLNRPVNLESKTVNQVPLRSKVPSQAHSVASGDRPTRLSWTHGHSVDICRAILEVTPEKVVVKHDLCHTAKVEPG